MISTQPRSADWQLPGDTLANDADALVSVLGVRIANLSKEQAIERLEQLVRAGDGVSRGVYIVNAHTLNLAFEDAAYRNVLNTGTAVLGDGTGVRLAARIQGDQMRANLVGTDLIPDFIRATPGKGYRYFLLGATRETIEKAAEAARSMFPEWELAGYHHGYVVDDPAPAIAAINAARPHMLLVGMGNPLQEKWIHDNLHDLRIPLAIGVGGLFDHWGGNISRAPSWVRRFGAEWLQILLQQPHKWRRYLIGNWKFLVRIPRNPKAPQATENTAG